MMRLHLCFRDCPLPVHAPDPVPGHGRHQAHGRHQLQALLQDDADRLISEAQASSVLTEKQTTTASAR